MSGTSPRSASQASLSEASAPVLPGATLGLIGGGQLGRMFIMAAHRMGYRVHVLTPEGDGPAAQVADRVSAVPYDDHDAVVAMAQQVAAVTYELEHFPLETVQVAERHVRVCPAPNVLEVAQHRLKEKTFADRLGLAVPPFAGIDRVDDLEPAIQRIGTPAVLKTTMLGYDGRGQRVVHDLAEAQAAWRDMRMTQGILEARIDLAGEFSVIVVRNTHGEQATYGPIDNTHHRHILDVSVVPADLPEALRAQALEMAHAIADGLALVGVLCIEMFLDKRGRIWINELAPRPHNSGHLTIEACPASQFEQQVRAMCNLPLGRTAPHRPAAMANLLGDLWQDGEPDWPALLASGPVSLHLYGKADARPGRKMGHVTALADTADEAVQTVKQARAALTRSASA